MSDSKNDAAELVATGAVNAAAIVYPPAALLNVLLAKIAQERQRNRQLTLQTLSDELERVRDRLDADFVQSDGFADLVEEVVEKANQRKEMDKRDCYAALLGSAALPGRPDERDIDRMIDTLGRLRPSHPYQILAG